MVNGERLAKSRTVRSGKVGCPTGHYAGLWLAQPGNFRVTSAWHGIQTETNAEIYWCKYDGSC
jgi:hypothetical protein